MDNIKIVDAHHHLWDLNNKDTKYSWLMVTEGEAFFGDYAAIRKNYLLEDYIEDTKSQNIIKSVHVQAEHDDDKPVNETAWLQNLADTHSSKLPNAIVAFADFSKNNVSEILDAHQEYKNTRGIRQILSYNKDEPKYSHATEDFMKNSSWVENFKHIRNRNLSFDIQIYKHQMEDAVNLANKYNDILFILNHTGEPCYQSKEYIESWEENMKKLAKCENVVAKISGLGMFDPEWTIDSTRIFVEKTIQIFGIERCMFASNFPVDKIFNSFDTYWNSFKEITKNYSENDKKLLFSSNAEKYYRI
ncbi:amidohydrolase family protein [Alphaproteobacteria bacterium]|jgi:predicted TIM-barrel fold metal-dependent hydrolase|nr:amidohydrolase family protein [Alphaproteobacteria bacterium]